MTNGLTPKSDSNRPTTYQIRLQGHLDGKWTDWFEGLTITPEEDGNTLLTGKAIDQAALHGLFKKMRDLGMPLVSVNRVEPGLIEANCSTRKPKMNTTKPDTGTDIKVKLSTLWIFVLLNMIYADIISLMDPVSPIRKIMAGTSMPSGGFLLAGAILMETSIAMVLLSRILKYKANRWINIIMGLINIMAVISGERGLYYIFFASIEVVCMSLIIWYAWKWTDPEFSV